jgi:hypothetical protein
VKSLNKLKTTNLAKQYATQCGNNVISLLERKPALDIYYGKNVEKSEGYNKRLAYGSGSGSSIQGYNPTQQKYYKYSPSISKIGKTIMEELKRAKEIGKMENPSERELRIAKSLSTLDLETEFNAMHIKVYFNEKATAWHNDNVHCNKDGKFKEEKNSVVPNTPAVICTIGDSRALNYVLCQNLKKDNQWKKLTRHQNVSFNMKNFSMFLVHPDDDKPSKSMNLPNYLDKGKFYKWQHQVKSTSGKLSMAIIFRVVKETAAVKIDPSTQKQIFTPEEIEKVAKKFAPGAGYQFKCRSGNENFSTDDLHALIDKKIAEYGP